MLDGDVELHDEMTTMNNDGLHDPGRVVLSSDGTHEGAGAGETRGVCESPPSPMPSRYATIVADPPWPYPDGFASFDRSRKPLPYDAMTLEDIKALPVRELIEPEGYLLLWTTNRYLREAFDVLDAWTFRFKQALTWCKEPMGVGLGGMFAQTTEFILVGQRLGPRSNAHSRRTIGSRHPSSWFLWKRLYDDRGKPLHSGKPEAFLDLVEHTFPGPYLEMFARRNRLGWDTWGNEALNHVEVVA